MPPMPLALSEHRQRDHINSGCSRKRLRELTAPMRGWAVLSDALAEVRSTREEYYEAELHRLRGELFLIQPRPNEDRAAAAFLQSLEVARHQHAKSWELRAATSL